MADSPASAACVRRSFQLTSGRSGMNTGVNSVDTGVVLYNMTARNFRT